MNGQLQIQGFSSHHARDVEALFIKINRLLAPPHLKDAFEQYIIRSIDEEIGRVTEYYAEKQGWFFVALIDGGLVGMFGLEPSGDRAMELRRMYVDPCWRRQGIAAKMLHHAEAYCHKQGMVRLELSTSELQPEALAFYRNSGYILEREEIAETASNKTLGGGIRRYYFSKNLDLANHTPRS